MKSMYRNLCLMILCFIMMINPGQAQQSGLDPFSPGAPNGTGKQPGAGIIASVEFVDVPITTIFKMISDLTGWSIIMSPEVSHQPPRINIWIKNLTPDQVLEQVIILGGLVQERKGNTIKIMTFDEYAKIYGMEKRVLQLKHAGAKEIAEILKPLGDKEQSKILADEGGNKIILLVAKPLLESLVHLIESLDVPFEKDTVKIIPLKYQEASFIVPALDSFLTEDTKGAERLSGRKYNAGAQITGSEPSKVGERWIVQFMVEPKLNIIILRGHPKDIARTMEIIVRLDVQNNTKVVSYQLKFTSAKDVLKTIQDVLKDDLDEQHRGGGRGKMYIGPGRLRISSSEQNNRIIVEGSPQDHLRVSKIIEPIDKPLPPGSGGMRVYRLENASSAEVVKVIKDLITERGYQDRLAKQERNTSSSDKSRYIQRANSSATPAPQAQEAPQANTQSESPAGQLAIGDIAVPQVTEAPEINAVIIKASAVEHEEFAAIIREMDKPRDQVILEVILVSVRNDGGFNLGLELGGGRVKDSGVQFIGFNTFGIDKVDPTKGTITIANPAPFGANIAIFKSSDISLVLNALQTVGDTRITSSPKILVQDNGQAEISQINQEPYEVTSQAQQSTETSFGGFVSAGTELMVIPHVSKADWVWLTYQINLSSFGSRTAQQLASNLPPPRRESKIAGTARIPENHVVVLGGLVSTRKDNTQDKVPFLGDIPILGEVFKHRTQEESNETLFIFIRPITLRDPNFKDLLFLSEKDIKEAKITNDKDPINPVKLFNSNFHAEKSEQL